MLIKRVYEIDPLACPQCGGQMKVIAFIEPPQGAVVEKILRHCGLWNPSTPRAPPVDWGLSDVVTSPFGRGVRGEGGDVAFVPFDSPDWPAADDFSDRQTPSSDEPRELTYVDIDTFEATF